MTSSRTFATLMISHTSLPVICSFPLLPSPPAGISDGLILSTDSGMVSLHVCTVYKNKLLPKGFFQLELASQTNDFVNEIM